jgi:hypothetical protein
MKARMVRHGRSSEHCVEAALQAGALSIASQLLTGGCSKVRGNGAVIVGKMAPHMKSRAKQQAVDAGVAAQLLSMTTMLVFLELGAPEAAEAEKALFAFGRLVQVSEWSHLVLRSRAGDVAFPLRQGCREAVVLPVSTGIRGPFAYPKPALAEPRAVPYSPALRPYGVPFDREKSARATNFSLVAGAAPEVH